MDRRRQWASVAALGAAALLLQHFVHFPVQNLLTRNLTNWMHVPLFVLVTLGVHYLRRDERWGATALIIAAIALGSEAVQHFVGRTPSLEDLARDAIGITIAVLALYFHGTVNRPRLVWGCAAVATFVITLAQPAMYAAAYRDRDAAFPVLYTPGSFTARLLTEPNGPAEVTVRHVWYEYQDLPVLTLTWADVTWPGLHLLEPVSDWRGYERLVVDAYNPEAEPQPLTVAVRHEGRRGTARHRTVLLEPGHNRSTVRVAELTRLRSSSTARVSHVILHTRQTHAGKRLLLGNVRLE